MYIVLIFLFCIPYIYASAADEVSDASTTEVPSEPITPRTDQCIPRPCAFTPRGLVRHDSVSSFLADSSQSQSDSPRKMPISTSRGRLIRHASVSSRIELSSSRSHSEDSPRLGLPVMQNSAASSSQVSLALPSPIAAYITDMQIKDIIQEIIGIYPITKDNMDTHPCEILRNISALKTEAPSLLNNAYAILMSASTTKRASLERKKVYDLYNPDSSIQTSAATRIITWKNYQTTLMATMNNQLKKNLPGVITKTSNILSLIYASEPSPLTPEQITYLHQHVMAYTYMLCEQENIDSELFGTLYASQITNYRRYQFSLEQQQSARPLIQLLLKPQSIGITDLQIAHLIHEHKSNGSNSLTKVLRGICVASLQTHEQAHDAHSQFMSIIEHNETIAKSRKLALNRLQPQIALRSECWQGYHLAIMLHLNEQLAEQIPNITTDHTRLYVAFMGLAPVILTPEQARHIIKYILAYAIMLSELETTDPEVFEHTYKKELELVRLNQPASPKITNRKRSSSSIGSFSRSFLFKKNSGASSSNS